MTDMLSKDKKTLLVNFSDLADLCGFGEIERNYAPRLAAVMQDEVNLIFIVPEKYIGRFGDKVTYIERHTSARKILSQYPEIDLWHSSHQMLSLMPPRKVPQLLTVHDVNFLHEKKGVRKLKHILRLRWRMKKAKSIVTISQYVKDELLANFPSYGKTVDVIYNGIAGRQTEQSRPAFVSGNGRPFLFGLGQIRKKKNFDKLVLMMEHLPEYDLYICGDDHFADAKIVRQLIKEHGDGRVYLPGKITDAEKEWLYNHASGYLFASALEGFGIPGLEAMRHSCPVFSSRLASLPEINGSHAFYWDNFNPEEMAEVVRCGIKAFNADPKLAEEARKYSEEFSYDRYTSQYVELYRKLLAE